MVSVNAQSRAEKKNGHTSPREQHESKRKISGILRWAIPGAVLVYLGFALLLGVNRVGLHYDEAITQHGAVHVLNSTLKPTFAYNEGAWIRFAGRYWPLAIIPYAGAVKDYVLLLPFALFGASADVARVINALLGALGIVGIGILLKREINNMAAGVASLILAFHPAYLDQTLFDYGVVVVWMALLGLISIAISYYIRQPSALATFLIGLGMGIGGWNRVNFAWFLAAALIAAAMVFRKSLLIPVRHMGALIGGGLLGVFPMVLFQIRSNWTVLAFLKTHQPPQSFGSLIRQRFWMFSEMLISDVELRAIWLGPPTPPWQVYFFVAVLIVALIACLSLKKGANGKLIAWRRASALTLIIFALIMFSSKLPVVQHHLVMLIPVAVVVVVLGFQAIVNQWKQASVLVILIAIVYAGSAVSWNVAAARGMRETGGVNEWSDAIYLTNDYLLTNHKGKEIKILDWGLQNNLYVLSNAKIRSRENFWGATEQADFSRIPWRVYVSQGGVFLTNARGNEHFGTATRGFLAALEASGQKFNLTEIRQRNGNGYADIYDVQPAVP